MNELKSFFVSFCGISSLQIPILVSNAEQGTTLAAFQRIGFPFNMSRTFLRHHMCFSPENMTQRRYHTLVTSLFNHADSSHLVSNLMVLLSSGKKVHDHVGRWHFFTIFFSGGIAGNLAMWLHYFIDKQRFQDNIINPTELLPILDGTSVGQSLDFGKHRFVSSSFETINSWMCVIGCSACVSAVVSFEACLTIQTLTRKLRQLFQRHSTRAVQDNDEDFELMYDLARLSVACSFIWSDLQAIAGSRDTGFGLFAHSYSPIGHSAHLAGFMFGVLYYFITKR